MNLSEYIVVYNQPEMNILKDKDLNSLSFNLTISKYWVINNEPDVYFFNPSFRKFIQALKNISLNSLTLYVGFKNNHDSQLEIKISGSRDDLLSIYMSLHGNSFIDFIDKDFNDITELNITTLKENYMILCL